MCRVGGTVACKRFPTNLFDGLCDVVLIVLRFPLRFQYHVCYLVCATHKLMWDYWFICSLPPGVNPIAVDKYMYRTCSLCLMAMDLLDCPMYALLQVLHFSSYIPLGLFWVGFSVNCWYFVFVARRAILRLDCLKRLVTFLTSGLW